MARPLQIDQKDTFYHVLNRGNEQRAIFRDDRDRGRRGEEEGSHLELGIIRLSAWAAAW
jgi:hypothetical protein